MKKKKDFGVNVGSSSLLLIFVILCLVSFAALSIVSANADRTLSAKVTDRSIAYYEACNQAQDRLAGIDVALLSAYENSADKESYFAAAGGDTITFSIPVSELQTLTVVLDVEYPSSLGSSFYSIKSWKLITTGELEMDESLNLLIP